MALHLIKLCVGVDSIEELAAWQQARVAEQERAGISPRIVHSTFQSPKRGAELLEGGSLFWVIKGTVQVRQRLLGLEAGTRPDGRPACHILLDPVLVPVRPVPRRAFQGWRYLSADDAPPDLSAIGKAAADMPEAMRRELMALGLL